MATMQSQRFLAGMEPRRRLMWLGALGAVMAIALTLAFVLRGRGPAGEGGTAGSHHSAPPIEKLPARPGTPALEKLAPLAADQARARNAAVPFADLNPQAALPFQFVGTPQDMGRATDCLAIAALAEAGALDAGQRAVMQVVLNRTRHPAYPHTVCGTVFQGSQRATGCQFTFTCDGALRRQYDPAAWDKARTRARQALGGSVYPPVGLATHYHTDWVYPYWSAQLDKIARVDTHLFFRWRGFWGTRSAFSARYRGAEPAIAALGATDLQSAPLANAAAAPIAEPLSGDKAGPAGRVTMRAGNGRAFFVHLSPDARSDAALAQGRSLCAKGYCQVMGWTDAGAIPAAFPVTSAARARLAFSYVRDEGTREIVFYDCKHFANAPREQCLPKSSRN